MLKAIQEFFRQQIEPGLSRPETGESATLLATAALLIEMMRVDRDIDDAERQHVKETLLREFSVERERLNELMELARQEAEQATDYFHFTSLINRHCDAAQKLRIVESLWRVAFADGHLDDHEAHLMKKIAGLLHVPHADYVLAKTRARDGAKRRS